MQELQYTVLYIEYSGVIIMVQLQNSTFESSGTTKQLCFTEQPQMF